jgi:DNA-binding transcriptional MerR regulator
VARDRIVTTVDFFAERRARRSYQSPDVCELARITYRQLDYWTRTGLIGASGHAATGSGDVRWYRDTDVVRAAVISVLLQAGLTLAAIRQVIDEVLAVEVGEAQIVTDDVRIIVALQAIRARVLTHSRRPA